MPAKRCYKGDMLDKPLLSLFALAALTPAAALLPWRPTPQRDSLFWLLLVVAVAGSALFAVRAFIGAWDSSLGLALWLSITTTLLFFALLCLLSREAWRLAPLLLPYLLLLGLLATVTASQQGQVRVGGLPEAWLLLHISAAVATYALATLAAVAGAAVFLQERRLKRKQVGGVSARLPSIAVGESLQYRLLLAAEVVLGADLLTGWALRYFAATPAMAIDHKTLLSVLAFLVILVLLWLQGRSGLRGRRAGRVVLLAYLLLTLAYPGVKFVTDVLLS
ncbi:cytochrome c biogenesis protein CcsA [Aquibaculum arenosum]|nr:cytochrome c biogenesis protein CcsA [Fodinicurvata sp. CAU 1616]